MRLHLTALIAAAAVAAFVSASPAAQRDRETSTTAVRYVANSGMLVTVAGRRFLIDAPLRDGLPPYATSSPEERAALENARTPYDNVDAILITHWHDDHFSPEAVAAHLTHSERTLLISSPQVVDRVRAAAPKVPASQLRAVLPEPGNATAVDVNGVPVRVLRIRHSPGARNLPEQHVGFLIGSSSPLLHVGDAEPVADNFALLKSLPPVDLAFVPFWFLSNDANRTMVAQSIRPRRTIAMHLPPADAAEVAAALRTANVTATLAAKPGTSLIP